MLKVSVGSVLILCIFFFGAIQAGDFVPSAVIDRAKKEHNIFAVRRYMALEDLVQSLKSAPIEKKLKEVNDFWNEVRYGSDMQVWHKRDYWATPWEFLGKDRGDCEDYVIAKYFTLKRLGVDPKKMYFVYAVIRGRKKPHMVLGYYKTPRSTPLILDNVNLKIFPADKRRDLVPIYLFNRDTLSRFESKNRKKLRRKRDIAKKKWDDLLDRMKRNVS